MSQIKLILLGFLRLRSCHGCAEMRIFQCNEQRGSLFHNGKFFWTGFSFGGETREMHRFFKSVFYYTEFSGHECSTNMHFSREKKPKKQVNRTANCYISQSICITSRTDSIAIFKKAVQTGSCTYNFNNPTMRFLKWTAYMYWEESSQRNFFQGIAFGRDAVTTLKWVTIFKILVIKLFWTKEPTFLFLTSRFPLGQPFLRRSQTQKSEFLPMRVQKRSKMSLPHNTTFSAACTASFTKKMELASLAHFGNWE